MINFTTERRPEQIARHSSGTVGRFVWSRLFIKHGLHEKGFIIDRLLFDDGAKRASKTLQRLSQHDISGWALAGGLAMEILCLLDGLSPSNRLLNDIDFVAAGFN